MPCKLCGTTPDFPRGLKKIYLFASHEYIVQKFFDFFRDEMQITPEDDCLIFETNFEDLIAKAESKPFTDVEFNNIFLIVVEPGEEITLSHVSRNRNLAYYIALHNSGDLKWILDNESILIYFQPVIECKTLNVYGYECLARGIKPDKTIMPPKQMFELARKTGMLFNLDRQCRIQAIKQAKLRGVKHNIFINFTPTSIYNPEFCLRETVTTAQELGFENTKITFEVVESDRVSDINHIKHIFDYYRKKGYKVALDDVGSGYSTLNMLAELRPDLVKIDMTLVRNIDKDNLRRLIVKSLVEATREIGAKSLAEGIETFAEFETIKELGVDLAQGYLFGKPSVEPVEFVELV